MKLDSEEILKCLCFVILGYFIAMMFSRMCSCENGFRVGGREKCASINEREECNNEDNCRWFSARQGMCQGYGPDNENNNCQTLDRENCTDQDDLCTWIPARNEKCKYMPRRGLLRGRQT